MRPIVLLYPQDKEEVKQFYAALAATETNPLSSGLGLLLEPTFKQSLVDRCSDYTKLRESPYYAWTLGSLRDIKMCETTARIADDQHALAIAAEREKQEHEHHAAMEVLHGRLREAEAELTAQAAEIESLKSRRLTESAAAAATEAQIAIRQAAADHIRHQLQQLHANMGYSISALEASETTARAHLSTVRDQAVITARENLETAESGLKAALQILTFVHGSTGAALRTNNPFESITDNDL